MITLNAKDFRTERPVNAEASPTITIQSGGTLTVVHPAEATTFDLMNAVEVSGVLDFWNDPEEDNYSDQDGDAI